MKFEKSYKVCGFYVHIQELINVRPSRFLEPLHLPHILKVKNLFVFHGKFKVLFRWMKFLCKTRWSMD